jgi:C2 domain
MLTIHVVEGRDLTAIKVPLCFIQLIDKQNVIAEIQTNTGEAPNPVWNEHFMFESDDPSHLLKICIVENGD